MVLEKVKIEVTNKLITYTATENNILVMLIIISTIIKTDNDEAIKR